MFRISWTYGIINLLLIVCIVYFPFAIVNNTSEWGFYGSQIYNKFVLQDFSCLDAHHFMAKLMCNLLGIATCILARDFLGAVGSRWNEHVLVIDKVIPPNWKVCYPAWLHVIVSHFCTVPTRIKNTNINSGMPFISFFQCLGFESVYKFFVMSMN